MSLEKDITIAITCIGSGIGQSIINSVRRSPLPIKILGIGNDPLAYGALECDFYEHLPSIYDKNYTDDLLKMCIKYSVKIIIPGMDDDVLILSKQKHVFNKNGIILLSSDSQLVSICRDKELLFNELNPISKNFAKTFSKEKALTAISNGDLFFPCIAKPRDGNGSLGIKLLLSINDIDSISDNCIIQELLYPKKDDPNYQTFIDGIKKNKILQLSEISVQIIAGIDGKIIGKMATLNRLKNGAPIEVLPIRDESIWKAVDILIPKLLELGMQGPLNIQGRMTDEGIKFFEINPRFTGITGLRAMLGFNEVEACIKNHLENSDNIPFLTANHKKFGTRQLAEKTGYIQKKNNKTTLLITGSTGYLGRNFIKEISKNNIYKIWILGLNKKKAYSIHADKVEQYFDINDMNSGMIPWGKIDVLLHMGFARPHCSFKEIADSIFFTKRLFMYAGMHNISSIINISSQSVYGQASKPLWKENSTISPETSYAMAKYTSELCLESEKQRNRQINITSLRLASLIGGQEGLVLTDIASKFVQQALENTPIEIYGQHIFERLDVRDAIEGIIKLLSIPHNTWQKTYNLGSGQTFTINELAETVIKQVEKAGKGKATYQVKSHDSKNLHFGMDSESFFKDTNWRPKYSLTESIQSLIKYFDSKAYLENKNN